MSVNLCALVLSLASLPQDEAATLLRYKFTPGETLRYRTEKVEKRSQNVGPSMESRQESIVAQKTIDVSSDGVVTLEMTYESIALEGRLGPGQTFRFDSRDAAGGRTLDAQERVLRAIVGRPFRARIDATGNVLAVEGFDEVIESVATSEAVAGKENPYGAEIVKQMKQSMGNDSVKQALSQAFRALPTDPVKPDADWTTVTENHVPLVGTFRVESQNVFTKRDDLNGIPCAIVETKGAMGLASESGSGFAGMLIKHTLQGGSLEGWLAFSPERGAVVKSTMRSETRMRIEFPQKPGEGGRPGGADYLPNRPVEETSTVEMTMDLLPPGPKSLP